jgi:hypothetical protein
VHYAYIDESGNTAPFQPKERFLVVAVVAAGSRAERALALHIKHMRRRAKMPLAELEAKEASPRLRAWFLRAIAQEDIAIIVVAVNKADVLRRPDDPEEWYRDAVARAAQQCAQRWAHWSLVIDRRYVKRALRDELEARIATALADLPAPWAIQHLDSAVTPGLQVADYVAWAVRMRYEANDLTYYALIGHKVVAELVVSPT